MAKSGSNEAGKDDFDQNDVWQKIKRRVRFPFRGVPGCTFEANNFDALDYFQLFVDDGLINLLVAESNRHALKSSNHSIEITRNEMQIFLCIIIIHGKIKLDETMWRDMKGFSAGIVPKLMTLDRYLFIKKSLHFSNNEGNNPCMHTDPILDKIWPVYQYINKKCSTLYIPNQDVIVNESLLFCEQPQRGTIISFIKMCSLCESETGYLFSFIMYEENDSIISDKYKDMPFTSQLVLSLADPLLNKGYCIKNNDHNKSPQLADFLVTKKTDFYGLLGSDQKDLPPEIRNKNVPDGEYLAFQKGKVMIIKWFDKKEIYLLSTVHNPNQTMFGKKDGNFIKKPKLDIDCNNAIDDLDQCLDDYRTANYFKEILMHLIDLVMLNSFILYKKNKGSKDNLGFHVELVEKMIRKCKPSALQKCKETSKN